MQPQLSHTRPRLIWRLVEESLAEASFLWTRLDQALRAQDHCLQDAERWVQERLGGALDGVRVADEESVTPLLRDALQERDPGGVSVAAHLLVPMRTPSATRLLEEALVEVELACVPAWAAGLGRTQDTGALHALWSRLGNTRPLARATLMDALAFCGEAPNADWSACLTAADQPLRRAAASACALLPSDARASVLWIALQSDDTEVRTLATLAGIAAGAGSAWRQCLDSMRARAAGCARLFVPTARLGSPSHHAYIVDALTDPGLRADALRALGHAGTRAAVEACISQLGSEQHAQLALQSIVMITGSGASPQTAAALPTETETASESGPRSSPSPAEPTAVEAWWARASETMEPEARYQNGKPVTFPSLCRELERGPNAARHDVAFELAARTHGTHRVQTLAFCPAQRAQLAELARFDPRLLRELVSALGIAAIPEA